MSFEEFMERLAYEYAGSGAAIEGHNAEGQAREASPGMTV